MDIKKVLVTVQLTLPIALNFDNPDLSDFLKHYNPKEGHREDQFVGEAALAIIRSRFPQGIENLSVVNIEM